MRDQRRAACAGYGMSGCDKVLGRRSPAVHHRHPGWPRALQVGARCLCELWPRRRIPGPRSGGLSRGKRANAEGRAERARPRNASKLFGRQVRGRPPQRAPSMSPKDVCVGRGAGVCRMGQDFSGVPADGVVGSRRCQVLACTASLVGAMQARREKEATLTRPVPG